MFRKEIISKRYLYLARQIALQVRLGAATGALYGRRTEWALEWALTRLGELAKDKCGQWLSSAIFTGLSSKTVILGGPVFCQSVIKMPGLCTRQQQLAKPRCLLVLQRSSTATVSTPCPATHSTSITITRETTRCKGNDCGGVLPVKKLEGKPQKRFLRNDGSRGIHFSRTETPFEM